MCIAITNNLDIMCDFPLRSLIVLNLLSLACFVLYLIHFINNIIPIYFVYLSRHNSHSPLFCVVKTCVFSLLWFCRCGRRNSESREDRSSICITSPGLTTDVLFKPTRTLGNIFHVHVLFSSFLTPSEMWELCPTGKRILALSSSTL